jgi:tetratricopeptide (TPR) repeat protein
MLVDALHARDAKRLAHPGRSKGTGPGKPPRPDAEATQAAKSAAQAQLNQAVLLRRRGQAAEAASLIEAAIAQCPQLVRAYEEAAAIAEAADDTAGAFACYRRLREAMPFNDAGYLRPARLASRLGDAEAAAVLLRDARTQLEAGTRPPPPAQEQRWQTIDFDGVTLPDAAIAIAVMPLRAARRLTQHWDEALRRLAIVQTLFPDESGVWLAVLDHLQRAGRVQQATAQAAAALARFGDDGPLLAEAAAIAVQAGDTTLALAYLDRAPAGTATLTKVKLIRAEALAAAGRHDEAETLLRAELERKPKFRELWLEYGRQAAARCDWDTAAARLQAGHENRPADPMIAARLANYRLQASLQPRPAPLEAMNALFGRFESLGAAGSWGCEFGMAQRRFGNETLGLLRWTSIPLKSLIGALTDHFEGVGTEAQTAITIKGRHYQIVDRKYGIGMHSFVAVSTMPQPRMLKAACQRMGFLRRKLLEELAAAEKVFVFKSKDPRGADAAASLLAALRTHGDATLLMALPADEAHPAGSVERIAEKLYLGYIGRFVIANDNPAIVDFRSWQAVCETVAASVWPDA